MKRHVATFGFLIALGMNFALAQPPAESPVMKPGEHPGASQEENPQTTETDTEQTVLESAAPETPDDTTAATAEPEPAGSTDSPFDYQASEQISEDLSVSFPVDI